MVGERDGRHLELCGAGGERRDPAGPVEDRVLGVDMKVNEGRLGHSWDSLTPAQDRIPRRLSDGARPDLATV